MKLPDKCIMKQGQSPMHAMPMPYNQLDLDHFMPLLGPLKIGVPGRVHNFDNDPCRLQPKHCSGECKLPRHCINLGKSVSLTVHVLGPRAKQL